MTPDQSTFLKKAKQGNVIPIYQELLADLETPVSAFLKIAKNEPYAFLFESVVGEEKVARYSFVGTSPLWVWKSRGKTFEKIVGQKRIQGQIADPFRSIEELLKSFHFVPVEGLPRFCGGLVGYLSYDLVRFCEKIPDKNPDPWNLPEAYLMLADRLLIFDHAEHKIKVVANAFLDGQSPQEAYRQAVKRIEQWTRLLGKSQLPIAKTSRKIKKTPRWKSNFSKSQFQESVLKAKEYIRAGDIIQAVLSQRFETQLSVEPFRIYRALRSINPSPYMFFLRLGEVTLVGSSPEILVRSEEGVVEVRPIAGTRPRGRDGIEEERLRQELLLDPKERAEHIMLVDLGRNDIGRVCEAGTVKVPELMTIEKYSHVMHLVSDVVGKLAAGKTGVDVIRATFPAGTVTGAPKIRAMEIIDELESVRRGPYAGAVGYFSFSGNLDSCITIRTIVIQGKRAFIQSGAGIVADSDPEREYQETLNKAKGMMKAVEMAQNL